RVHLHPHPTQLWSCCNRWRYSSLAPNRFADLLEERESPDAECFRQGGRTVSVQHQVNDSCLEILVAVEDQVLFTRKIIVECLLGDIRGLSDIDHTNVFIAMLGKHGGCSFDDTLPCLLLLPGPQACGLLPDAVQRFNHLPELALDFQDLFGCPSSCNRPRAPESHTEIVA